MRQRRYLDEERDLESRDFERRDLSATDRDLNRTPPRYDGPRSSEEAYSAEGYRDERYRQARYPDEPGFGNESREFQARPRPSRDVPPRRPAVSDSQPIDVEAEDLPDPW
jgi:hypothetical protein